jgi:hypothetical protein
MHYFLGRAALIPVSSTINNKLSSWAEFGALFAPNRVERPAVRDLDICKE